jgi:hypothetical protein
MIESAGMKAGNGQHEEVLVAVAAGPLAEAQLVCSRISGVATTPRQAIETAIAAFLAFGPAKGPSHEKAAMPQAAGAAAPAAGGHELIFDGWVLLLPSGSEVRARANRKAEYVSAHVRNDILLDDEGNQTTGSKFAKKIAGPGRNLKQVLEIKRPQDADFIPAKDLFESDEVTRVKRAKRDRSSEYDIPYVDVLDKLTELETAGFPSHLFRHIHHKPHGIATFRKYASNGIEGGVKNPKTTSQSMNGITYRRVAWLVDNAKGQKTDAEWLDLIGQACEAIPREEI